MRCEHADLLAVVATNHRPQTVATVLVLCVIGCVLIMVLCTFLQWVTNTIHSILTTTLISPSCASVSGHMDDKQSSMQPDGFYSIFSALMSFIFQLLVEAGLSQTEACAPLRPREAYSVLLSHWERYLLFISHIFLKKKTLHTHCCICFHLPGLNKWNEGITLDSFLAFDQCC